jgi:hypothetical protein
MDGLVLGAARFYPLHRAAHCAVVVQPKMLADLRKTLPAVASNRLIAIALGETHSHEAGNDLYRQDHARGIIDYACCLPRGKDRGYIGVAGSLTGKKRVELVVSGKVVHIDIRDERGIDSRRAASIPASELTSRGFDLANVDDNDGLILPKSIAAIIWEKIWAELLHAGGHSYLAPLMAALSPRPPGEAAIARMSLRVPIFSDIVCFQVKR